MILSTLAAALLAQASPAAWPTSLDPVLDAWTRCLDTMTERFWEQPENADTIADAVMGSCRVQEARFTRFLLEARRADGRGRFNVIDANEQTVRARAQFRAATLGLILQRRTARSH